jgi:hypothetical protein
MTKYEKAVKQMERYATNLTMYYQRDLITELEAVNKFSAYVRCMVDNELCGAGYGADCIEKFSEDVLK